MKSSMKTLACTLILSAFLSLSAVTSANASEIPESDDPIKLVLNNWTSQVVLANVMSRLLQKMGYDTELVPADNQLQFQAMAEGDLHMQVEVWEGTHITNFNKAVASGNLLDAGTHIAITREEWWYPTYVEEKCPGLPDWKALNDCAELFAVPETQPEGRYVGGPIDWGKYHNERVEALGMDFEVMNVGQASTLWAELEAAYRREEPIVLFNWTPNWVEAKYEGRFVDFPDYDPRCWTDASWGSNPDMKYDCGAPKSGWLKKAAHKGVQHKWPGAWRLLTLVNFSNPMIAEAAAYVDVDGMAAEAAAEEWIKNNEEVWSDWVDRATNPG